jgi:hypothetical protein
MSEMMLEKERSCSFFEIVSLSQFIPLLANCSNKCRHAVTIEGRNFWDNFKCTWKGNEFELLAPITTNKNGCESNKNLETMINTTNAQPPKYVVDVMIFIEMKPIPPLELGSKTYQHTKAAFRHSNILGPKSLLKTCMKVKLKDASWCQKFGRGGNTWSK